MAGEALISVVVPAYNAGRYIAETINSVRNQSHHNLEIIIVDDGSTDDTIMIVERMIREDPRIVLMRSPHKGASHARNLAIAAAKGEYIAPLDSDDIWTRDKLARQLAVLRGAPENVGVAYCWAAGIDDHNNIVLPVWNPSTASGNVLHAIVKTGILSCGSTPLIRKHFIVEAGGYDENCSLGEDWKFYTALAGVCEFAVIPECLTGYRIREDSMSVSVAPMEASLNAITGWIEAKWPDIPQSVMRERAFTISTYLAFMAIRSRRYREVPKYLWRAAAGKPDELLGLEFWQFVALAFAHAAGLRRYEWTFWRAPQKFEV